MDSAEQAFQRSKIYRLFSYCFSYPEKDLLHFLSSGECLRELELALLAYPQGAGMAVPEGLFRELKKLTGEGELAIDEQIRDEHIRLFTLKSSCSPYETDYYRSFLAVFSAEDMADVAGFYRSFGMDFNLERPDYIATELEFMHLAAMREAEALFRHESEKAALCRQIEKKFLEEHLGRWVSAFSEALASTGSRFYSSVAAILDSWIDCDCRHFDVSPQKVTPFYMSMEEEEPSQLCEITNDIVRGDL